MTSSLSLPLNALDAVTLAQIVLQGLLIGGFYGLLAVGLNVIFGLMKIINISQGDFIILGAYASYWLYELFRLSPLVSLVPVALLLFGVSLPVYRLLIRPATNISIDTALIVTFGLSVGLQNLMVSFWRQDIRLITVQFAEISVGGLIIPSRLVYVFSLSLVFSIILYFVFRKTLVGKAIQAVSLDATAAALTGVNVNRIQELGFGIGLLMAGLAGALLSFSYAFDPISGLDYTLVAFVVIVLGGVGNPLGAFSAGLILGVVDSVADFISPGSSTVVSFAVFLMILLAKPEGLFRRFGGA